MIAFLIEQITGGLWPYLVAGGAALLGVLGAYVKGRADAKAKITAKQAAATVKAVEAGAKGAAKAANDLRDGKTPDEIVRKNDGAWQ